MCNGSVTFSLKYHLFIIIIKKGSENQLSHGSRCYQLGILSLDLLNVYWHSQKYHRQHISNQRTLLVLCSLLCRHKYNVLSVDNDGINFVCFTNRMTLLTPGGQFEKMWYEAQLG